MNYSAPVYNRDLSKKDIQVLKEQVDEIIDQQIIICQMSNGITYQDTENMDEYERLYIISKLIQMRKDENEAKQRAYDELANKNKAN